MYEQSCSTSDPKKSWSVKIDKIENVTVKNTFAGTDQTTWKSTEAGLPVQQNQFRFNSDEEEFQHKSEFISRNMAMLPT